MILLMRLVTSTRKYLAENLVAFPSKRIPLLVSITSVAASLHPERNSFAHITSTIFVGMSIPQICLLILGSRRCAWTWNEESYSLVTKVYIKKISNRAFRIFPLAFHTRTVLLWNRNFSWTCGNILGWNTNLPQLPVSASQWPINFTKTREETDAINAGFLLDSYLYLAPSYIPISI